MQERHQLGLEFNMALAEEGSSSKLTLLLAEFSSLHLLGLRVSILCCRPEAALSSFLATWTSP